MMVPFSAVVMWTFGKKIGNSWKKILWYSGKIAFIFSISIEMLQLLLRLGTFQLSDISSHSRRSARRIDVLCGDEGKKASIKLDEIVI